MKPKTKDLLLGEQAVLLATEEYTGKYYHISFDNFFTSVKLIKFILKMNIHACGTAHLERQAFWPTELKNSIAPKQ
jgi:hypothetical protein